MKAAAKAIGVKVQTEKMCKTLSDSAALYIRDAKQRGAAEAAEQAHGNVLALGDQPLSFDPVLHVVAVLAAALLINVICAHANVILRDPDSRGGYLGSWMRLRNLNFRLIGMFLYFNDDQAHPPNNS